MGSLCFGTHGAQIPHKPVLRHVGQWMTVVAFLCCLVASRAVPAAQEAKKINQSLSALGRCAGLSISPTCFLESIRTRTEF